jgi:hypothetical protein
MVIKTMKQGRQQLQALVNDRVMQDSSKPCIKSMLRVVIVATNVPVRMVRGRLVGTPMGTDMGAPVDGVSAFHHANNQKINLTCDMFFSSLAATSHFLGGSARDTPFDKGFWCP